MKNDDLDMFGERRILIANQAAYAGTPGSGPTGKTCKHCAQYTLTGSGKTKYRKCGLVISTNGKATDIKAGTPACNRYTQTRAEYYGIDAVSVTKTAVTGVGALRKKATRLAEPYAGINENMSGALEDLMEALTKFENAIHDSAEYLAESFE